MTYPQYLRGLNWWVEKYTVSYAYPTSELATKYGFGQQGCYLLEQQRKNGNDLILAVFPDFDAAFIALNQRKLSEL